MVEHEGDRGSLSRRGMLKGSALALAGLAGGGLLAGRKALAGQGVGQAVGQAGAGGALTVAHLTDLHIQPERGATEGVAACLRHVGAGPKVDLILTGGDLIMDGFEADEARTRLQWELLTKTFADHAPARVEHCLGNHDIWGWNRRKSGTRGDEPRWGKAWAEEALATKRYRSVDVGRWHIVVLDSTNVDPNDRNGYIAKLDEAQMAWLEQDLASVEAGRHTLVVSHIPILTVTTVIGRADESGRRVSGGLMHVDNQALMGLFDRTKTVRACISGHMHRIDQVSFRGVEYYCNGAVSGSWWKGANAEAVEGYARLTLHEDGRTEREYVTYGWQARE